VGLDQPVDAGGIGMQRIDRDGPLDARPQDRSCIADEAALCKQQRRLE
jgi:hypothetical protein